MGATIHNVCSRILRPRDLRPHFHDLRGSIDDDADRASVCHCRQPLRVGMATILRHSYARPTARHYCGHSLVVAQSAGRRMSASPVVRASIPPSFPSRQVAQQPPLAFVSVSPSAPLPFPLLLLLYHISLFTPSSKIHLVNNSFLRLSVVSVIIGLIFVLSYSPLPSHAFPFFQLGFCVSAVNSQLIIRCTANVRSPQLCNCYSLQQPVRSTPNSENVARSFSQPPNA